MSVLLWFKNHIKYKNLIVMLVFVTVLVFFIFYLGNRQKTIFVKYRQDPVNLSEFDYLDTSKSTFVEEAWFRTTDKYLILKLKDTYYQYCNFPVASWNLFKRTNSFGSYYNNNIKDFYSCNKENTITNNKDDFIFDHIIPLSLGGADFSQASIASLKSGIEKLPSYNISYSDCLYEAIKEESKMLIKAKYMRQSDGSWVDKDGDYPNANLENNIEIQVTKSFKNCIN